jgi:pyruvate dehydrogenase E2 component (dihydrolipoamide acetyltransferase)
MREFTLPSLGADMESGKLIEWLVKPGEEVHKGQVVAVVDTSKAAIDVEIWYDGVVGELRTTPGETLAVGAVMATILDPGEAPPEPGTPPAEPERAPAEPEPAPGPSPAVAAAAEPEAEASGVRRRISPAARHHAAELGLDLDGIAGTGPLGAVTLADVDAAASRPGAEAPTIEAPAVEPATPAERQASMRAAIAAAMSRSKREIPHYYLSETIPMARAVDWLTSENAARSVTERVLMAAVQLKAVGRALADFPQLNGFFVDGAYRPAPVAHIGVAIALRQGGLVAPALHDVVDKDLPTLMRELSDLVARTRAASLRSTELSDATITVTNLGDQGVQAVFGIITPPQVALVGFGRVALRPFVTEAGLEAIPTVTASLAADHRVSDGRTGAQFLASLHDWLQRPEDL